MADQVTITLANPLTEDHLAKINAALDTIQIGKQAIALAKRANIEVPTQEAALLDAEQRLRQIKQVFFPGR